MNDDTKSKLCFVPSVNHMTALVWRIVKVPVDLNEKLQKEMTAISICRGELA